MLIEEVFIMKKIIIKFNIVFLSFVVCSSCFSCSALESSSLFSEYDEPSMNSSEEVNCGKKVTDFLQAVCDDIYKKTGKEFKPITVPLSAGYHGEVYKLRQ